MPKREYDVHPLETVREYKANGKLFRDVRCTGCWIKWVQVYAGPNWLDVIHPEEEHHPCCCCTDEQMEEYRKVEQLAGEAYRKHGGRAMLRALLGPRPPLTTDKAVSEEIRYCARQHASFDLHDMADAVARGDHSVAFRIWLHLSDAPEGAVCLAVIDYLTNKLNDELERDNP